MKITRTAGVTKFDGSSDIRVITRAIITSKKLEMTAHYVNDEANTSLLLVLTKGSISKELDSLQNYEESFNGNSYSDNLEEMTETEAKEFLLDLIAQVENFETEVNNQNFSIEIEI